jgi:general secretion pathway protein G
LKDECLSRARRTSRRRPAFTLIELLAAMTIIGALAGLAIPRTLGMLDKAKLARAIGDLRTLQVELMAQDTLPDDLAGIGRAGYLDPWGHPYVYFKFGVRHGQAPPGGARRDRFLVPVNSEFDLYSMGADGRTTIAFTAKASRDDIVRALDGDYIGLVSAF